MWAKHHKSNFEIRFENLNRPRAWRWEWVHWRRDWPPRAPTQAYISLLFSAGCTFLYLFQHAIFLYFFWHAIFFPFWPWKLLLEIFYISLKRSQYGISGDWFDGERSACYTWVRQAAACSWYYPLLMMMLKYNLVGKAGRQAARSWYYHADRKPIMALPHHHQHHHWPCVIIVLGMAMGLTDRCSWWRW